MNWWIFIHSYLWKNSLRRCLEQPLTITSKLVVSALLAILGALIILGMKELGAQIQNRLQDREILAAIISESVYRDTAPSELSDESAVESPWRHMGHDVSSFWQLAATAELESRKRVPVWALDEPESYGLLDEFYLFSERLPSDRLVRFSSSDYESEARVIAPLPDARLLVGSREILVGSKARLMGLLMNGFTKTTVLHAKSADELERAHNMVSALSGVEGKRVAIRSNLRLIRQLEEVLSLQAQALLLVVLGSSMILGLVLGSLAWMEFREERYLLALIRSFGVSRRHLLVHALMENCLLALLGVLLGMGLLHVTVTQLDLEVIHAAWLGNVASLYEQEARWLLSGALIGGILACVPVAIGLRKPIGLVLK